MKPFQFLINCVSSSAEAIDEMIEQARVVTYTTVDKHCNLEELESIYEGCGSLTLSSDRQVSFYKSKYAGKPCYYVVHSAIEYIFTRR